MSLTTNLKLMIRLNNPNKTKWDIFIIVLAVYNSFQIPFEIAFEPEEMKSAKFFVFNTMIDLCFAFDIIVNFRTSYFDSDTGEEVFDPKRIGRDYLKSRFTIDLLSTVPFDNIALLFTRTSSPILQLFTLLFFRLLA